MLPPSWSLPSWTWGALALVLAGAAAAPAAPVTSIPAPVGLEQKLVDDAKDGKLDHLGILEAALIASGVPDADVAAEARRVKAALAPAIARAKTQSSAHKRGAMLLQALHETVFRTYAIGATEIDDVARTGEYNCLSSALLYVVAAEGLVDNPRAMVTKHHAFARVDVDNKSVDVETTTPAGFDADRDKLMTPDYVKKIAGVDATPQELLADLKHPEELPVLSLVAAVYNNRAVGLVSRGDLQGAAVALDRAQKLASGSLRARAAAWRGGVLNAGAIALVEQNRLDDARALLTLALDGTEGDTRRLLTENLGSVELHLADRALGDKDWLAALAHVDAARRLGAPAGDAGPLAARAQSALAALEGSDRRCRALAEKPAAAACFEELAVALVKSGDVDKALQEARQAHGLAPSADTARVLAGVLVSKARAVGDKLDCAGVESLVREAARVAPAAVNAGNEIGVCWARKGDAAFDKQDWASSSSSYRRALASLPGDAALQGNLARVDVNNAIEVSKAGDCDRARVLARRAEKLDQSLAEKGTQILEACASMRAKSLVGARDWAGAAAELRRGLRDAPKSEVLRQNLGTMLHNLAAERLQEKDCDGARALLPELTAFHKDEAKRAVEQSCPPRT